MKNIHMLPTDKLSRLFLSDYGKELNLSGYPLRNYTTGQHIYITNSEEIKKGDWCLDKFNQRWKLEDKKLIAFDSRGIKRFSTDNILGHECKKIILTIDQDLIKDGVQAIDDEFLEWFVQNPSCEEIEVEATDRDNDGYGIPFGGIFYKIIIPKEETKLKNICIKCGVDLYATEGRFECQDYLGCKGIILPKETLQEWADKEKQKQHLIDMIKTDEELRLYEEPKQTDEKGKPMTYWGGLEKPKQETTPEEVAEYLGFVKGVKWQMERSYSEEEVLSILNKMFEWYIDDTPYHFSITMLKNKFEQFKKK